VTRAPFAATPLDLCLTTGIRRALSSWGLTLITCDVCAVRSPPSVDSVAPFCSTLAAHQWGLTGLSWLYNSYAAAGITFTDIFGWEADTSLAAGFFDGMPKDVFAASHFYPRPVNNKPVSPDNPLVILESVAKPEDFVVFKLDIDSPQIEKRLIADILRNPRVSCLIDELFFEHHAKTASIDRLHGSAMGTW
jgi:hypothetical protein